MDADANKHLPNINININSASSPLVRRTPLSQPRPATSSYLADSEDDSPLPSAGPQLIIVRLQLCYVCMLHDACKRSRVVLC